MAVLTRAEELTVFKLIPAERTQGYFGIMCEQGTYIALFTVQASPSPMDHNFFNCMQFFLFQGQYLIFVFFYLKF